MAFTPMTDDLDIISKYPDEPYEEEGFTSTAFKASFDQGAKLCKDAINRLVEELNTWTGALVNAATARGIGFLRSANVPADNVQDAIDNVQSQLVGITQGGVADGSITDAKVAADADVNGEKIKDASVPGTKLVSETLGNAHLPFGALLEDVTDSITLTPTGTNGTESLRFFYCKALGIVLVRGTVRIFPSGTDDVQNVYFSWGGSYLPKNFGGSTINTEDMGAVVGMDSKRSNVGCGFNPTRNTLNFTFSGLSTGSGAGTMSNLDAQISGWYFCEAPAAASGEE